MRGALLLLGIRLNKPISARHAALLDLVQKLLSSIALTQMPIPEIDELDKDVDKLIADGARSSAVQLISDTVSGLVRQTYDVEPHKEFLVHYTTIDVLFSLLSILPESSPYFKLSSNGPRSEQDEQPGFLRLYDTNHSNDPNEGQLLIGPVVDNHRFAQEHPELWKLLQDRSRLPAYIASFRGISKVEETDDLIFWRTYGREGKGCALVFPVSFLGEDTPVFEVKYGANNIQSTLDQLSAVFDGLSSAKSIRKHGLTYSGGEVPKKVASALSPMPYLYKSDDYCYENEVRVVVPYLDIYPNALYCHQISDYATGTKLRHFAHFPKLNIPNLLRSNSFLYIGPAVPSKNNLEFVLNHRLQYLGLSGIKIRSSKIDYRS